MEIRVEISHDEECALIRQSMKESIIDIKNTQNLGKEEKKDLKALKRVLDYYCG